MTKNAGYLFYKKYFNSNPTSLVNVGAIDDLLSIQDVVNKASINFKETLTTQKLYQSLILNTTYPGLISGSGYMHDVAKGEEGQQALKIGFYFDHTSGTPVIPGSSIKGVLRGLFPSQYKGQNVGQEFRDSRYEFIAFLINQISEIQLLHNDSIHRKLIDNFELEWFEGIYAGSPTSIYKRDIFMDAVPISIATNFKNDQKRLFGSDYITPHRNRNNRPELDIFSDPNPIQFLKVMPKVMYQFSFVFRDSVVIPNMTSANKHKLVKEMILMSGLGAKTNVGYGQLKEVTPSDIEKWKQHESATKPSQKVIPGYETGNPGSSKTGYNQTTSTNIPTHIQCQIKKGNIFSGKVLEDKGDKFLIEIEVKNSKVFLLKAKDKCDGAVLKDIVDITFNADCSDQPNFKVTKSK